MIVSIIDKIADRVRWGYLTAFILLLISYILTFYSSQQVLDQQTRVQDTRSVINTLDVLLSELKDTESAFRGYIILKDEKFLEDYYNTPPLIDSTFFKLKSLTSDDAMQQKRLDTLHSLIKNKLNILSSGLSIFRSNGLVLTDTMRKMGYQGKLMMDSVKMIAIKLKAEENALLNKRSDRVTTLSNFIKVINIVSIVVAIVLAFYSITIFNKENKEKQEADKQAEQFRQQLELRANELYKVNVELLELRGIEKFAATGRIARNIAHEVRNPLTNINLATEHLRSEIQRTTDTDILFEMIARNSNRINELISDLLNSTKASHLTFTTISVNDILDQSLGFAQDRIDLKEIKVIKNYDVDLCPILADVEKINIAFLNIIVNAVEAMEAKKGILTIKTENKNNRCTVIISDNGKGIDKESLLKIFEPYYTTKDSGNGLGLTNTQNIILSHHANIYAESEEGKGSSFIISFDYADIKQGA
jgi:signal transduction histidine kinase